MSTNNRVIYAIQALGFAPHGVAAPDDPSVPSGFVAAHGVQSVGINTTFNLEPVYELGQLELYENIEGFPAIEVTAQKVLDGYPLLYHLATPRAGGSSLIARTASERCYVGLNIYPDTNNSASGTPLTMVGMSGMYLSRLSYGLKVDGNSTEDVTLVGNDKVWFASDICFLPDFDGTDDPLSLEYSGGVQRREDVLMGVGADSSTWPTLIPGISSQGKNGDAGASYSGHIQNVTITCDLGRTELFELGRRGPYYRFVNFPVEVTCAIETTTSLGDQVDALADPPTGSNLQNEEIVVCMREGAKIDLGDKNKLASVTYGGGNAGGGNATVTYNFSTRNTLTVTHPQDPSHQT